MINVNTEKKKNQSRHGHCNISYSLEVGVGLLWVRDRFVGRGIYAHRLSSIFGQCLVSMDSLRVDWTNEVVILLITALL